MSKLTTESLAMAGGSHAPIDEGEVCIDCGNTPCSCGETLSEVTPPGFKKEHPGLMGDLKKEYPGEPEKAYATAWKISKGDEEELEEAAHTIEAYGVKGVKSTQWRKTFKNADDLNNWVEKNDAEVYGTRDLEDSDKQAIDELADLRRLSECGPMPTVTTEPKPMEKMNVTTNMDAATGNQTVTVSAEGDSAEELMRILQMAGIAVAPSASTSTVMAEKLSNEPAPNTLDANTQLVSMSGGLNGPKGQYNGDRARDNSMSITQVDEAVAQLERRLAEKFLSGK